MQTIIISIHPQHVKNIFDGKKTLEIRKRAKNAGIHIKRLFMRQRTVGAAGCL